MLAVQKLAALAHETRLEAYRRLVAAGHEGRYPSELAEELGIPAQTLSFHLKELTHAGLAVAARQGRSIQYRADLEASCALLEFIATSCCQVVPMQGGSCSPKGEAQA